MLETVFCISVFVASQNNKSHPSTWFHIGLPYAWLIPATHNTLRLFQLTSIQSPPQPRSTTDVPYSNIVCTIPKRKNTHTHTHTHTHTGPTDTRSATQNSATTLKWGSYFYPVNQPKGMRRRGWNKPEREILTLWIIQCSRIIFPRSTGSSIFFFFFNTLSPSNVVANGQFEPNFSR